MVYKIVLYLIILVNSGFGESYWVKYGWELFNTGGAAPSIALGNTLTAYHGNYVGSYLVNPAHPISQKKIWTISHQSRFAGMINRELIGFPIKVNKHIIQSLLIYEGIGQIPDTRNMLLDWGMDGQFGTNDIGEGNGILDEGERLDPEKVQFFGQHQFGAYFSTPVSFMNQKGGIGMKVLYHSLGDNSGVGVGFNIGIIKNLGKGQFGVSVKDIPSSGILWNNGAIEGTIPSANIGYSFPIVFKKFPIKAFYNIGSHLEPNNRNMFSAFGSGNIGVSFAGSAEWIYRENISLQVGRSKDGFISSGVGLNLNNVSIHYAFRLMEPATQLGNNHYISLSFHPSWILEKLISTE